MTGFRELGTKLRNWRRWGPDDELGTVNFITPTSRKRGAWEFLFAGPGLKITGSVGSPITPVAVL
jgi:hypothetical protein